MLGGSLGLPASLDAWLQAWIEAERGRFVLFLPVAMGAGALCYFSLRGEPPCWLGAAAGLPSAGLVWYARQHRVLPAIAALLLMLASGFASAQWATWRAPPLENIPSRATIVSGVVRSVEQFPGGRRISLENVRLDLGSALTRWVRVRLRANDRQELAPGDLVRVRALLHPPQPPAYPGAWDTQRDAWYSGLAGAGFALGPIERIADHQPGGVLAAVQQLRETIARRSSAAIPGAAGAVATTLLTGITSGIPPVDHDAFRASGLAHLLAVAGLHIGIVMGWSLAFARLGFALSEPGSLFWPTKHLAGLAALLAGAGYMVLTGMHVPIVRSFVMACLFTVAMLVGRRAISLRGLGLAAIVLLLLAPQEVTGVSFQMSFAAVLALVAGYEALRPVLQSLQSGGVWRRRVTLELTALALTSALAGIASAPFGAYHFGRIQLYFIVANMLAVPLAAFWVMPAGLIALLLMPFGLDALAWVPMGWGIDAILWVARTTAALPAATLDAPHLPPWGLAMIGFGMAWLGIWRSRIRLGGIPLILLGLLSPLLVRPPDLLVSDDARLIGVRIDGQVYLQQLSGASRFTRDAWLQYWASGSALPIPRIGRAADGAITCTGDVCRLHLVSADSDVLLVRGAARPETCANVALIISAEAARGLCARPWPELVDRFTVWRNGAAAVWLQRPRPIVLTDRAYRGTRPWVPPPPKPVAKLAPALPPASSESAPAID